jgi:cytochrome c oxidase cbb3-type subunit 3
VVNVFLPASRLAASVSRDTSVLNLTDDKWILGGGIEKIFHTISEGGRPGKGMVAWKTSLNTEQRQQVASYVISLQGTTPANPKEPQGDITWSKQ